jgi:hypothetical protein
MFNTIVGAGVTGAGAALRYGSGSDQIMRLLAAPVPQHWQKVYSIPPCSSNSCMQNQTGQVKVAKNLPRCGLRMVTEKSAGQ